MKLDTDTASISAAGTDADPSTHTSDRRSARPQRIEVITRGERRRRWSLEEKQAIVAESLAANVSITGIARRHGIGTGQLYGWRHQLLSRRAGEAGGFVRVAIANTPRRLSAPISTLPAGPSGWIEIMLPGGVTVRVDAQVDERALHCVLAALGPR